MSQSSQSAPAGSAPVATSGGAGQQLPYRKVYAWVFQAWLVMFLAVICAALIFYLMSYIPGSK